ncbi:energy transducer TonB [Polaromonas sp. JS666]|uniref:energy transducer TonB family protein n=1 Tax=Polaromonas sp. (strain JS666 / ATCC BAA-500) TaxID=296591 RepID=UPI0008831A7F|nr:energy transducer TonB [Polaromonas sp. JS666]SDN92293.1 TonB family C-terminal domain-containing protein [Polaromonas sp. JS666]
MKLPVHFVSRHMAPAVRSVTLVGLLAGCAATGNPTAPRTPNPAVPLAASSSLPEFPELFKQMGKLYADHPQAPKMQDGDGMGQKISIARVRKPGALDALQAYRAQGLHGRVVVIALLDAEGKLLDARVLSSTHAELNEAVLQSAREAEYRGGRINGAAAPMYAVYGVNF